MTTREFMSEGFDGYEEFVNCVNIDHSNDIATMFVICLKFFELVSHLNEKEFELGINVIEPGSFGFNTSCENIFKFMKQNVIFIKGKPEVVIESESRIKML
jgi:hypothetical protein